MADPVVFPPNFKEWLAREGKVELRQMKRTVHLWLAEG
jgi:hypothetical protein